MSVPVDLERVREEAERFGTAPYLVTVNADSRPHVVAVAIEWVGDELRGEAGKRTIANATERPEVCLLWPPSERGGYSLIVDVTASNGDDGRLGLRPTKAVLHRPAAEDATAGGCGADCVPLS